MWLGAVRLSVLWRFILHMETVLTWSACQHAQGSSLGTKQPRSVSMTVWIHTLLIIQPITVWRSVLMARLPRWSTVHVPSSVLKITSDTWSNVLMSVHQAPHHRYLQTTPHGDVYRHVHSSLTTMQTLTIKNVLKTAQMANSPTTTPEAA
jgi:hypothetical protein